MKLLYCEDCGDIIAPHPKANEPRDCRCGRHAVWWVNPFTGVLRVCDKHGRPNGWPSRAENEAHSMTLPDAALDDREGW